MVRDDSLYDGDDCAAHDGHVQQSRSGSGERTELGFSQAENGGEHDGVEQPDGKNSPHGNVAAQNH